MKVVTVASAATLPHARTLARSLSRHQPDWSLDVVMIGPVQLSTEADDDLHLRPLSDVLDVDAELLIASHDEEELVALLVPRLLRQYAQRSQAPVLHLPATAWVLDRLDPITAGVRSGSVLLVARSASDLPPDGMQPSQRDLERAGRVSATVMAVDGTPSADGFLTWWSGHLERTLGSADGQRAGARPEDREWLPRYLELAPARFSVAVLDDPGCNLSMWNLHGHSLRAGDGVVLVDDGSPLRFMDLPGFRPDRPYRLNPLASRVRLSRSPALRDLCVRYAHELHSAGWRSVDQGGQIGRRLADGLLYDAALHALQGSALTLGEEFGDVFSEPGTRGFTSWLEGPAPRGSAHGINRYLFYRVARERPDVVRAYPDLDGPDGAQFVAWCWAFGQPELAIPDRFMPPSATQVPSARVAGAPGVRPASGDGAAALDISHGANAAQAAANGAAVAVRVSGYLGHTLGLGAAARGYVKALAAAGVPVSTVSVPLHHLKRPATMAVEYGQHAFEDLVHTGAAGFELVAVNADELPDFVQGLASDYFEGPRIGVWGWETNSIPSRWRRAFELIDEIWVYSRFMAENIGAVAPVPVTALAPPVEAPSEPVVPLRMGVPEGFLFLFVFDYLSTIQRKNPVGLIEAFKRAFAPGEGPQLLIKTINAPLRPLAEEELLWAAHERPDIHIVDRSLDSHELAGLMAACDCYVSLHRSEGFGLTLAEAMAIGKPVIATRYSGNLDFMNDENSYLVDYEIGRVGAECEIYPADGEWAEPNREHAAELMRLVCAHPHEAARIGGRARADVESKLSPLVTGTAMRRRLERLRAGDSPSRTPS
jgi:Glycosyl transferases group 1